jgi:hypothetical protein
MRYRLREGLELHLEVAEVAEGEAVFDPVIKGVESLFRTVNPLRQGGLTAEPRFMLVRPDGRGTRFVGSRDEFGDVWLGVKGAVRQPDGWRTALSWRAALKLPTGRFPSGSGAIEAALGLLSSADFGRTHAWLAADLMLPDGPVSPARLGTRPHPAFQLGVGREVGGGVTFLVQGSAHGPALRPLHLSEIDGWTFYLLAGARLAPTRSLPLGLGVVENLFVSERGTDIAGIMTASWRF